MFVNPCRALVLLVLLSSFSLRHRAWAGAEAYTNSQPVRINALLRMRVENRDGTALGGVRNVLLNLDRGTLHLVLLAPEGLLAGRNSLRATPPEMLSTATAKRNVVAVDATPPAWEEAPTFEASEIARLNQPEQLQRIRSHYQGADRDQALVASAETAGSGERLSPTGRTSQSSEGPPRILLATDLLGEPVIGRNREPLGQVTDLLAVFDSDAAVFVLISPGRLFRNHDEMFAIPLKSLNVAESGRITLNADRSSMNGAKWLNLREVFGSGVTNQVSGIFKYQSPN